MLEIRRILLVGEMLKSAFVMQYKFVHLQNNHKRHSIIGYTNLYAFYKIDKRVYKFVHHISKEVNRQQICTVEMLCPLTYCVLSAFNI